MTASRVTTNGRSVSITWDDPKDAIEAGYVIQQAGLGPGGGIRDHGFYDDGTELILVAEEILSPAGTPKEG